jgi:hypothetical protein
MPIDMSPAAIDARLREQSRLSPLTLPHRPSIDMSPEAIEQRLRELAQLRALWVRLRPEPARR